MTIRTRNDYPDSLAGAARALRSVVGVEDERDAQEEHLLRVASEIGETNPRRLTPFLLKYVVPKCVAEDSASSERLRIRGYRLRELLRDWLDALPEEVLWPVRAAVLRKVIAHVNAQRSLSALYCLSGIGYRSRATVTALRRAGKHNDSNGHEALRLLLGLGPADTDREWVRNLIASTPEQQRTDAWFTAAAQLHDRMWIGALADEAATADRSFIGISRLAWVGDDAPGDRGLQDEIWSAIMTVVERRKDGWPTLLFTGGLFDHCNTPAILAAFVNSAGLIRELEGMQVVRWIDRLQDVRTPLQVEGWRNHDRRALEDLLIPHIERSSGGETVSRTIEADTKGKALETLLCSGNDQALSVAATALENETNGFTVADVLNRLGSLSAAIIPGRAREALLTSPVIDGAGSSNSAIAVFLAASRFVASSLHIDSLRLLLASKGTRDGHPYRQPVQAAARLAVWLSERGDNDVLDLLLSASDSDSLIAQAIAVSSLSEVLLRDSNDSRVNARLQAIAADTSRESYIRREALAGLVSRKVASEVPSELFVSLSLNSDLDMKRLAFCGLLMQGRLEVHRANCEEFAFAPPNDSSDFGGAYVAGAMSALEPSRYSSSVAHLIERGTDWTTHGVLAGFRFQSAGSSQLPAAITSSLVRKIHAGESEQRANPDLFNELAFLAPRQILEQPWESIWYRWMPDSRVSLADSIPIAATHVDTLADRAEELLDALSKDGVFAVRRAAARARSKTNPESLAVWCDETLQSGPISLRRFAAEAAAWLPVDSPRTLDNAQLRTASKDPERLVRSAAARAREALRLRHWSADLMAEVTRQRANPNEWVLNSYAAGAAVSHIGDDSDLRRLAELAESPTTPPNVAHWMTRIVDSLQAAWKDRTAKWPGSWLPWQGALEQVDGTLSVRNQILNVRATLWLRRGEPGRELNAWGGAAWVLDGQGHSLWFGGGSSGCTLTVSGRAPVEVLLVATDGHKMVFTGNDSYPEPPGAPTVD